MHLSGTVEGDSWSYFTMSYWTTNVKTMFLSPELLILVIINLLALIWAACAGYENGIEEGLRQAKAAFDRQQDISKEAVKIRRKIDLLRRWC